MRADALSLHTILDEKQQWVVPVYQRHYEWETGEETQLDKFWEDLEEKIVEQLEERDNLPHYFGAIIYSEPKNQPFGGVTRRYLVDGQQRVTTFKLTLAAIREVARNHDVPLLDVINNYLFNVESRGMKEPKRDKFKLWPSSFDRKLFQSILNESADSLMESQYHCFTGTGRLIKKRSPKMLSAYWYLYKTISEFTKERIDDGCTPDGVLDAVLRAFLSGFQIVVIRLDDNDDAQEIFSSLNGLGKPLAPFDLIRNDVFHRALKQSEDDEELFEERWHIFENSFWMTEIRQGRLKRARADHLVAHTVVAETAREVNVGKISVEYQRYAKERQFPSVAAELDVLLDHASTYRQMEKLEGDHRLVDIARLLRIWDMSTFHPLVLWVARYVPEHVEWKLVFDMLESYIVRREICGLTSKNYNKIAVGIIRAIKGAGDPPDSFREHIRSLGGDASRFPNDAEVVDAFMSRPAYGAIPGPRLRYILVKIEYATRTRFDESLIAPDNLTVEHILPRRWAKHWPLPNGEIVPFESQWEAVMAGFELDDKTRQLMDERQRVVDSLGNLTLVNNSLNPSMGNGPWDEKRKRIAESLLAINREVAKCRGWDEKQIQERAVRMASVANSIWPAL